MACSQRAPFLGVNSYNLIRASQVALGVRNLPANEGNTGDMGWIPGSGRAPGGGHGNPLQSSCLENPMDRGGLAGCSPFGHKEAEGTVHSIAQGHLWQQTNMKCVLTRFPGRSLNNPNDK